ncbi:augmin complex subunit dgt4 [Drosophila subpulchrella]|uniref:augmin complex subunit dgt4 n=1 Tax=Drosophila subpulchrella TaxID=1486046 RepID=UPI0018A16594|nr:augmin complex subunit dgt4 [Drosophila subpulchrella]
METSPTSTSITPPEGMDDIQYLLHLEAMRRYQEDSRNVKRQVEEQVQTWLDAKYEYQRDFGRLARLLKCAALQKAVDAQRVPDVDKIEQAAKDIASLRSKLSSDLRPATLNSKDVEQCREHLKTSHAKPRQNLSRQQREFAQNQEAFNGLRTAVDGLENGMELGMMQAMDRLVDDLLPPRDSFN